MKKHILILTVFLILATVWPAGAVEPEIRALWVTNQQLLNPARIDRLVDYASTYNFNLLFVQVRRGGEVYFNSQIEPKAAALTKNDAPADFDPLAYTLRAAHAKNLSVQAWLNIYYLGTPLEFPVSENDSAAGPTHVRLRYPQWLINLTKKGQTPADSQYTQMYLSPSDPGVNQHVLSLCQELINIYPIDGLHLDYLRYPNEAAGLTRENISAFRKEFGLEPADLLNRPAEFIDKFGYDKYSELKTSWQMICARPINDFLKQIKATIAASQKHIVLSAAVVPEAQQAGSNNYQDWAGWLKSGLVDFVVPMCYSPSSDKVLQQVKEATQLAGAGAPGVVIGLGAWRLTPSDLLAKTKLVRDFRRTAEAGNLWGICYFSYDKLFANSSYGQLIKKEIFANPAPLPAGLQKNNQYAGAF